MKKTSGMVLILLVWAAAAGLGYLKYSTVTQPKTSVVVQFLPGIDNTFRVSALTNGKIPGGYKVYVFAGPVTLSDDKLPFDAVIDGDTVSGIETGYAMQLKVAVYCSRADLTGTLSTSDMTFFETVRQKGEGNHSPFYTPWKPGNLEFPSGEQFMPRDVILECSE